MKKIRLVYIKADLTRMPLLEIGWDDKKGITEKALFEDVELKDFLLDGKYIITNTGETMRRENKYDFFTRLPEFLSGTRLTTEVE